MSDFKEVTIGGEAKVRLKKGLDTLADAVKATLGPRGRHAAIERPYGPPLITKDGVTVARSIQLPGKVENMGAQLIKSVAASANAAAGDGTTTATVLAQAIFDKGYSAVTAGHNPVLVKRGIDLAVDLVVKRLLENSVEITDEESVKNVATISANNDAKLGAMIADVVSAVGEHGFITVDENPGGKTEIVYADGLKIDRGLLSLDFISNQNTLSCDLENPMILCYDDKIENIRDLGDLLTEIANQGRALLIIARDYNEDALAHILYNRLQNKLNWCAIKAPGFGNVRREMMRDVAVMTGSELLHNDHGRKFDDVTLSDLGSAVKVSVGLNETSIFEGSGDSLEVEKRIETLEAQIKNVSMHAHQADVIRSRISIMTGGMAYFKVGGASESEVREKKDRVEDAINAVRSALTEGVQPGGGAALIHASRALDELDQSSLIQEEVVGVKIVKEAVQVPLLQILDNAGESERYYEIRTYLLEGGNMSGYDALRREKISDMLSHGVIDPTKVVRSSLEQAASASGTLLTTEVTIAALPEDSHSK